MKNLLIATTALVATGSVAAADITFSGGGRFGVIHTGSVTTAAKDAVAITQGVMTAAQISTLVTATTSITSPAATDAGTASTLLTEIVGNMDNAETAFLSITTPTVAQIAARDLEVAAYKVATDLLAGTAGSAEQAASTTKSSTDITNRITFNIDGSAETDTGVEFFGRVRIRGGNQGDGATSASAVSAPRLGVKIGSLTVAVGNIYGAIDSTAGVYSGSVGLTGLGYSNVVVGGYDGFSSGGGGSNGVEVIYSTDGMTAHLSHSTLAAGDRTALALTYAFGDWKVALAHQAADLAAQEFTMARVDGSFGDISVGAAFASNDVTVGDKVRINASFKVGADTTVAMFVTDSDLVGADTAYGLGFTHSLGGATLAGGIVENSAGQQKADLGVRFNF